MTIALAQSPRLTPIQFPPGDTALAPASADQQAPGISRGGDKYLAVWQDGRGANSGQDIFAARLDSNGNLIDTAPLLITDAAADQITPTAVWNGQNWLVVWVSQLPTQFFWSYQVQAVRVSPEGVVLDKTPLTLSNLDTGSLMYTASTDGSNWLVVYQGSQAGDSDVKGVRISPDGTVLDPSGVILVPQTFFLRFNFDLVFVKNEYILFWDESNNITAARFSTSLQAIGPQFTVAAGNRGRAASNGTDAFVIWPGTNLAFQPVLLGTRVTADGTITDPGGAALTLTTNFQTSAVTWDGANWIAAWAETNAIKAVRVTPSGVPIDSAPIVVDNAPTTIKTNVQIAGAAGGGAKLVWQDNRLGSIDIFRASLSSAGARGTSAAISKGAPSHVQPRFATDGTKYLCAFLSQTSGKVQVMSQLLNQSGAGSAVPVSLATGAALTSVSVAWNGSLYLVVWSDTTANQILGRRVSATGTPVDAAPFVIMAGIESDVAANGSIFLVVGTNAPTNPEFRFVFATRVDGSTGTVLGSAVQIGASFAVAPKVSSLGTGWIAAWESHPTHDDPHSSINAALVDAAGNPKPEFVVQGSNIIPRNRPAVASNGSLALVVWEDPRASASDVNIFGKRVQSNGTILDSNAITISSAANNQQRAAVAWDGTEFVAVWEDLRAIPFFLDLRPDIFAARVTSAGQVLDPNGIAVATAPIPEIQPAVVGSHGVALIGMAVFRDMPPLDGYRIGVLLMNFAGNALPVAQATASPMSGTAPLTVFFDSAGSFDSDGTISTFKWNFGDGTTATGATASHTYANPGTFFPSLTVTDNRGAISTTTLMVTPLAAPPPAPPVAVASATPASGPAPLAVTFSSAGSSPTVVSYSWNFGDGTTSSLANPAHTFANPGTYSVLLIVTDASGATGWALVDVSVTGVLRSTAIGLTVTSNGAGLDATGTVTVQDSNGTPIPNAQVTITWTVPGPLSFTQIAQTDASGVATFTTNSSAFHGTFTLTVNDIKKTPYTFDKANSVLTKSVTK